MKIFNIALPLLAFALGSCNSRADDTTPAAAAADSCPTEQPAVQTDQSSAAVDIPAGVQALMEAYPDFVQGFDGTSLLLTDGSKMTYDDKKSKTFAVMLDDSDVEDMFYTPYTVPRDGASPSYQADAGRSRSEALFKKMYGASAAQVQSHLTNVNWLGHNVRFININGAADSLRKVAAEMQRHPELRKYLDSSGTFYWRPVRGAKRLSAHSYGIAFDIGVKYSDYWLWKNGNNPDENARVKYANRIPLAIVDIFQKYGFIWGGAWYHYDTMHFEFRPEIIKYAQLTNTK